MTRVVRLWLPLALVAIASAWLVATTSDTADWSIDAWPAVDALAHGHLSEYLSAKAMMGPFATLVQTPFAAVAGGGELDAYHWAAFPCVLAAGLLGLYLAGIARRQGASVAAQVALAALCLVNPLTIEALRAGHPEEILTAALAVAAVASAGEGKKGRAALLLGLAVASKQWAVIAVLPTLMALPGGRLRVAVSAGALAVTLMLPGLVASPSNFFDVGASAANTGRVVTPWSVWYPVATVKTEVHRVGETEIVARVHEAPRLVGSLSHPLIVLLALGLPLALALRRGSFGLSGADAMALLALLALLRSALDPVDNLYYHEPLLLALLGWDALDGSRRLPVRGLIGAAVALVFWSWSNNGLLDPDAFNAVYIVVIMIAGLAVAATLFRPDGRSRDYSLSPAHNCPRA